MSADKLEHNKYYKSNNKGRGIQLILIILDFLSILLPSIYFINTVSLIYPVMIAIVLPFVFREHKLYWRHGQVYKTSWLQVGHIIRAYLYIFLILCVFTFVTQAIGARPSPANLSIMFALIILFNITFRLIVSGFYHLQGQDSSTRFVIVGNSEKAQFLATEIKQHPNKMRFLGYVVKKEKTEELDEYGNEVVGFIKDLDNLIQQNKIESIVVVMDNIELDELLELADKVSLLPVHGYIFNNYFDVIRQKYWSVSLGSIRVSAINRQIETVGYDLLKRFIDISISVCSIVMALPLFLVISIVVKITSRGPIFYISERVRNNKGDIFNLYKFRSMYVRTTNDEEERKAGIERGLSGNVIDSENTKVIPKGAVTPFGHFLRKSSMDELPQLFNVLLGDMSLVGPRPTTVYEFNQYKNWHKRRLEVKPGITGLWQVVARSQTTFDDQVKLDLYYSDHKTIWFDLDILIKTIPVVLFGKGGG